MGLMGKVLLLWSNGEDVNYYPHICVNILKSTPSVLIILIRVIKIVDCKVCKSSSVRGMQIPYDVLFWMVGQECIQKKIKKK